jgi:predicted Zn-dependent peptidase
LKITRFFVILDKISTLKMILDRTTAPESKAFRHIPLPVYKVESLKNGIPVYVLQYGNVEACEIQLVFKAGSAYESKIGIADFATRNMSEGTKKYSALQFAQELDRYGAWLEFDAGNEFVSINLTSLSHLLKDTLPFMQQAVLHPTFPEKEFQQLKARTLQKLEVNQKKSAYIASREFPKLMYGEKHPYAATTDIKELQAIELQDIIAYHAKYYGMGNCFITAVGKFSESELMKELNAQFGDLPLMPAISDLPTSQTILPQVTKGRHTHALEGVQSTIRMGHSAFNRHHADADKMELVNTIFGGFFGSRLMKNIREEKGYTYGIYSQWAMMLHTGMFYIHCDLGNEYVDLAIEEVRMELRKLIEKGVTEDELQLVKNYRMGKSISERETAFKLSSLLRFSLVNEIPFEKIDQKYAVFAQMNPDEVQAIAAKYYQPDDLTILVCGKG